MMNPLGNLPRRMPVLSATRRMSFIKAEAMSAAVSATYTITVPFSPHKMSAERRQALASIVRTKAREIQAIVGLLCEDSSVEAAITTSALGQLMIDVNETLDEPEQGE